MSVAGSAAGYRRFWCASAFRLHGLEEQGVTVRTKAGGCIALLAMLGAVGTAVAHDLDHPPPSMSEPAPLSSDQNAGGPENGEAEWHLVATIPTGNPQTDLDFFTVEGITYMSVGSLAAGINGAGQNIIQLTNAEGEVEPAFVTGHPSATCPKATSSATGLQHDSEAAPKGNALVQFPNPYVDTSDTQIVVDATDATGRCHDQGVLGAAQAPPGGLEIIDVTDPTAPKEIGLTSHTGMAHTVNVDPKRPHIAFVSSSDAIGMTDSGARSNEVLPCAHPQPDPEVPCAQPGTPSASMDGIEAVDMSSCMNFLPGTSLEQKRTTCDPQVFRYRWPDPNFARSHTYREATGACHELEIYPDDRIVCAALHGTVVLDFSGAFDDNGTPTDYTDDKLRGTPLPCNRRESSTQPPGSPLHTGAFVEDCVTAPTDDNDETSEGLNVYNWMTRYGAPSLEGVERIGTFHHMGFNSDATGGQQSTNFDPKYESLEDIFVAHEAELTQSGDFVFVTDERGGGVLPGGASCSPGQDNPIGNGGIHAFRVDRLSKTYPEEGDDAVAAYQEKIYATDSEGNRAIYRAPVETEPQGSVCTSHVMQQIPGQNRIFMGWYSQGTQVVDFTENRDGTIDFERAGFWIPEHANTWTSHIFKVQENTDGTFTYWGATGDFLLGDAGRNAVDIYQVTLSAPPTPAGEPLPGTPNFPKGKRPASPDADPGCASAAGYNDLRAKPRKRRKRVRFSFDTVGDSTVDATIFRRSNRRRVVRKKVKRFEDRERGFTWRPRRARNGFYDVRFVTEAPNGSKDKRHLSVRRKKGRFYTIPLFDNRSTCSLMKYTSLKRSVFGGKRRTPLKVKFNLAKSAAVEIELLRRGKVVRRLKQKTYSKGTTTRKIRLGRKKSRRGAYRVALTAERPGDSHSVTLFTRHL
jgi:hypothetical protein